MARRSGFSWDEDTFTVRLRRYDREVDEMIGQVIDFQATRAEAYAKTNAPWSDRTTNARNGLFARGAHTYGRWPRKSSHTVVLAHTVPYGVWLEVRWNGRYSIIEPTLRVIGRDTMSMVQQVYNRRYGG
jgi:hypothetical protein